MARKASSKADSSTCAIGFEPKATRFGQEISREANLRSLNAVKENFMVAADNSRRFVKSEKNSKFHGGWFDNQENRVNELKLSQINHTVSNFDMAG
jgi:hypothetical protein